ncbi:MAG: dihydroorotate dehydrogenase [Alphaproteobacteria bacterium]|nr:dihydroorotate dehydrogenase [Alphaproteobacteria bacterium]MDB5739110.1 dihydroorotate dehydrogenase [Alphaproteobacteria bacterium]
MTTVFQLDHVYEQYNGDDETKSLGLYSSREKAEQAIERYKSLPGFRQYPDAFVIYECTLDWDAAWTEGFSTMNPHCAIIYKIVPRAEWMASTGDYDGSAHDKADGFLHFSIEKQLAKTLELYYADQTDLMLVAVDAQACGDALKWEYSETRDEDFPHLYGALSCDAMKWARPIAKDASGNFVLPPLA